MLAKEKSKACPNLKLLANPIYNCFFPLWMLTVIHIYTQSSYICYRILFISVVTMSPLVLMLLGKCNNIFCKITPAGSTGQGMISPGTPLAEAAMPGWVAKSLISSPKGPWVLLHLVRVGGVVVAQQPVVRVMHQTTSFRALRVNSSSWNWKNNFR